MKFPIIMCKHGKLKWQAGFTLVEIMVATSLFLVSCVALLSMFDYTLKINRKSEALREASQGMRNFVEFLVKEVRNGQIDYGVVDGITKKSSYPVGPCDVSGVGQPTYAGQDNKLGVVTSDGSEECIYLAYGSGAAGSAGSYVGNSIFTNDTNVSSSGYNPNPILALQKVGVSNYQSLNPPNYRIEKLMFLVRPVCDPYTTTCAGGLPNIQPLVNIVIKFVAQLPTGEQVPIYYQTTVSENTYDIPNQ